MKTITVPKDLLAKELSDFNQVDVDDLIELNLTNEIYIEDVTLPTISSASRSIFNTVQSPPY